MPGGTYVWWQAQNCRTLKRINTLIKGIERNRNEGSESPSLSRAAGPRRFTDEHRLAYQIAENEIRIAACRCRRSLTD
jgi:toxin YoeB